MHQIYEMKVLNELEWRQEQNTIQWIPFGPKHTTRVEVLAYLAEHGDKKVNYLIKKEEI